MGSILQLQSREVWARSCRSTQDVGEHMAELDRPATDRLIRKVHTTFQHQFLDLAQAQVEPGVEPDNMSDDLGRKAMAFVVDCLCRH